MPENSPILVPVNYVALLHNIIAVTSSRGAFKPEEFKPIGEVYEFLQRELKKIDDLNKQNAQENAQENVQLNIEDTK